MKSSFIAVAAGALAVVSACSQSDQPTKQGSSSEASILIEGVHRANLDSALLAISDVQVTADGHALAPVVDVAAADLARAGDKLAVRVLVPDSARELAFSIALDDFGGWETHNGKAGDIDARGAPLRFRLAASDLVSGGKASLRLDLSRSLVNGRNGSKLLLPHYQLEH